MNWVIKEYSWKTLIGLIIAGTLLFWIGLFFLGIAPLASDTSADFVIPRFIGYCFTTVAGLTILFAIVKPFVVIKKLPSGLKVPERRKK